MRVKIRRQRSPFSESYWQTFRYEGPMENSVAGMLDDLNYRDDLVDENGEAAPRIGWECSCLQAMCGSCAMVINGTPALACETFLKDLNGDLITVEPLQKFPVIADLVVDRSVIEKNLKAADLYIAEYGRPRAEEYDHQYAVAKCLKCGLCLEVCPNYAKGKRFFGAAFANDCYFVSANSADGGAQVRKAYAEHFAAGCSKALSCMDVCPMGIPTLSSMAKMNRNR